MREYPEQQKRMLVKSYLPWTLDILTSTVKSFI